MVKYLINSLDANGFLSRDLFSISSDLLISDSLDISEEKMLNALNILQQCSQNASKNTKKAAKQNCFFARVFFCVGA